MASTLSTSNLTEMLPLPGSPGSSWVRFWGRLKVVFKGADLRVCIAFWLFGLINNVLYVIILTAALDLVGPTFPKGVVLLADVLPSFGTKLVAPYFIHLISYPTRILVCVLLSVLGMIVISVTPSYMDGGAISTKLVGVVLASLSSGGGELSFLGMTHFYGPFSLAFWGSGTGAAGLVGAGAYALATTSLGFSVTATLLSSACLPAFMLLSFFVILPREPLKQRPNRVADEHDFSTQNEDLATNELDDDVEASSQENAGLLSQPLRGTNSASYKTGHKGGQIKWWIVLKTNLKRSRGLFFPFMLPLLLVYIAEYTINQGVAPTLLFPLEDSPFQHYRAFYPAYNAVYQVGVFISRSSTPFFRVHFLYLPSFLQILNLVVLTLQALFTILPNIYLVFLIIFWEGLLGGLVYVNTFAEISDQIPPDEREFSLGATTVSDSGGICIAGLLGMLIETWLCSWQLAHGKDYCTRT